MFTTGNRGQTSSIRKSDIVWASPSSVPTTGATKAVDQRALQNLRDAAALAAMSASPSVVCRATALMGVTSSNPFQGLIPQVPGIGTSGMFNRQAAGSLLTGVQGSLGSASRSDLVNAAMAAAASGALRSSSSTSWSVANILGAITPNMPPLEALTLTQLASVVVDTASSVFSLAADCVQMAVDGFLAAGSELANILSGDMGSLLSEAGDAIVGLAEDALTAVSELPQWAMDKLAEIGEAVIMPIVATAEKIAQTISSLGSAAMNALSSIKSLASDVAGAVSSVVSSVAEAISSAGASIIAALGDLTNMSLEGLLSLARQFASIIPDGRTEWAQLIDGVLGLSGLIPRSGQQVLNATIGPALSAGGVLGDIMTALNGNGGTGYNRIATRSGGAAAQVLSTLGRGSRSNTTMLAGAQAALATAQASMNIGGSLPSIGRPDPAVVATEALKAIAAGCGTQSATSVFLGGASSWISQLIGQGGTQLTSDILDCIEGGIESCTCRALDANRWSQSLAGWSDWSLGRGLLGGSASGLTGIAPAVVCPGGGGSTTLGGC